MANSQDFYAPVPVEDVPVGSAVLDDPIDAADEALERGGKNWPPFSPVKFLYHDITREVHSTAHQTVCTRLYYRWWGSILVWVLNIVSACATIPVIDDWFKHVGLAVVYSIFFTPLAFVVYFLFYKGVSKHNKMYVFIFYVGQCGQIILEAFFALGLSGGGTGGFVLMINLFSDKHSARALFQGAMGVIWVAVVVADCFLFFTAWRIRATKENVLEWDIAVDEPDTVVPAAIENETKKTKRQLKKEAKAKAKAEAKADKQPTSAQSVLTGMLIDTAVANKDTLVKLAVDNKDVIKEQAIKHKDVIAKAAWENREAIGKAVSENASTVAQVASENPDTVNAIFNS